MSSHLFGSQRGLRGYTSPERALSAIPTPLDPGGPGDEPARAWFTQVITAATEINQLVIEIASGAEALPQPTSPPTQVQTLQELVQAGRVRLSKERARKDRDRWGIALAHVSTLEQRLRP